MRLRLSVILLLLLQTSVFAVGALYARRPLTSETGKPLWLKTYDAKVSITDQIAVTHIDQVFKNETAQRLEGIFVFPLPEGAVVTELALWINGVRVVGDVMEKDTARAVYESIVRKSIDPALLEYLGDNVFRVSVFPIEANGSAMSERRIELTYAELLPFANGEVTSTFFMKTANMSAKPVERASVSGTITSQKEITSLTSSTHPEGTLLSLTKTDTRHWSFEYGNENAHSEKDLSIGYRFKDDAISINHLVYIPDNAKPMFFDAAGDEGYFLLWVTPPHNPDSTERLAKNIAFVADVSSSMTGKRIIQLRESLRTMIAMLGENDRFSITAFSTGVQTFAPDMVSATAANKLLASEFVDGLSEAGLTNYEGALKNAFANTWDTVGINVAVFFTDGEPTWPVASTKEKIINTVKTLNTAKVALYTFGLGDEPDKTFLHSLAVQNGGVYQQVPTEGTLTKVLSDFMQRISYPLVSNCKLTIDGIGKYDVYPRTIPNLFAGSQLSVMGRFKVDGTSTVAFNGKQGAKDVALTRELAFDKSLEDHPFVPRMWASSKIDYLLGEIALAGEQKELVDNVKLLGKKYSIITPYTSMLVLEPSTGTFEDKRMPVADKFSFSLQSAAAPGAITLKYALPLTGIPARVLVKIFDAKGRLVHTLVDEWSRGGNFLVPWNGRTKSGMKPAAGRYFAVLEFGIQKGIIPIDLY